MRIRVGMTDARLLALRAFARVKARLPKGQTPHFEAVAGELGQTKQALADTLHRLRRDGYLYAERRELANGKGIYVEWDITPQGEVALEEQEKADG